MPRARRKPKPKSSTFVGIRNEREFYSDHYLAELLEGDIRGVVARWREDAEKSENGDVPPDRKLRGLAKRYVRFRERFARETDHRARIELQRGWFRRQLAALGHGWHPGHCELEDGTELPALDEAMDAGGQRLLVLGAYDAAGENEDPLSLRPHREQFHTEAPPHRGLLEQDWSEIVTRRVFAQERPPRWVLLLSFGQTLLLERGKWSRGRLLRFDWGEIVDRGWTSEATATRTGPPPT